MRPSRPTRPQRPTGRRSGQRPTPNVERLHRIVTHKPYCAPSRQIITGALGNHGVRFYNFSEEVLTSTGTDFARRMKIEAKQRENLKYGPWAAAYLPMAWEATFYVSKDQASWAEYLLERTQRLMVVDGRVDKRNRSWADRHDGVMPTPWDDPGCAEGQRAKQQWQQITGDKS